MTTSTKLEAGAPMPGLPLPLVTGGESDIASTAGWRMLVVYRGKHCPLCKKYLKALDGLLGDFTAAGVSVLAASADTRDKAEVDLREQGWRFPIAFNLSPDQMRTLGLYISEPRSSEETNRPFAEPGLFVINPEGDVQIVDISNAPFARPDLAGILNGIKVIQDKRYPIRGTMR